jgi:phosphoglycolate phosphatase-like HAD superfamily hydrolase
MMRTIVWDVDDVLNNLMQTWLEHAWKPAHPECSVTYAEITENPPHRVLGVRESEYFASLDEFRQSDAARYMKPNGAILQWLRSHGDCYRHVALTARPLSSTPQAAEWLFRHFGDYFRCFGVVPSRREPGTPRYDRNKGDFLAWLGGADLLVDDSPENVKAAEALGIDGALYPQPWNCGAESVDVILKNLTGKVVVS